MMMLSRKTDYALLILSHLHHHPDGAAARVIAERYGLNRGFVANILKELAQKGFVVSHRGVKGGYALLRPAASVRISEVLESLDEGFRLASCTGHDHSEFAAEECAVESMCPIKGPIGELHRRIVDVLGRVTLAELFQSTLPAVQFQPELSLLNSREPVVAHAAG